MRKGQSEGEGSGGGKIGLESRKGDGPHRYPVGDPLGEIGSKIGKIEGGGERVGRGIHRADDRVGGIRIGEGTRLVHVDLKPLQIRHRIQRGIVGIRFRGGPTQGLGGKCGSAAGRGAHTSNVTGRGGSPSAATGKNCPVSYTHLTLPTIYSV